MSSKPAAKKKRLVIPIKLESQPPTPSSLSSDDESFAGSGRLSVRKETEQRRRNMMNQHFDELVMMLSMVTDRVTPKKMDKTSILEEVVRVLQQYYDLDKAPPLSSQLEYKPGFFSRGELFNFLLDALGAFLMMVLDNGRILYCSDLITSLTGHMPTRLVGQTIYDCVVSKDESVIRSQFEAPVDVVGTRIAGSPILAYPPRKFNCSMRLFSNDPSSMTISRDFVCLSYLRKWVEDEEGYKLAANETSSDPDENMFGGDACSSTSSSNPNSSCILFIGKLANTDRPRDQSITTNDVNFEFSMRVSKQGKVLEVDKQASLILGFTKSDIQGSSFFDYVDPYHSEKIGEAIELFLSKGLGVSQPYRLVSKSGQYIWIVSKGFLSYNPWNHKPDHVLLQSKVLGCDEVLPEYKFRVDTAKMPNPLEDYSSQPLNVTETSQKDPPLVRKDNNFSLPVEQPVQDPKLPSLCYNSSSTVHIDPMLMSNDSTGSEIGTQSNNVQMPMAHFDSLLFPSFPSPVNPLAMADTPSTIPTTITTSNQQQQQHQQQQQQQDSMETMAQQLERKNRELFELQRRMLEQQQLFEQERRQFYQVTNQVMTYIGGKNEGVNMQSYIDPNMSMAISNSSNNSPVNAGCGGGVGSQAQVQQKISSSSIDKLGDTFSPQFSGHGGLGREGGETIKQQSFQSNVFQTFVSQPQLQPAQAQPLPPTHQQQQMLANFPSTQLYSEPSQAQNMYTQSNPVCFDPNSIQKQQHQTPFNQIGGFPTSQPALLPQNSFSTGSTHHTAGSMQQHHQHAPTPHSSTYSSYMPNSLNGNSSSQNPVQYTTNSNCHPPR